MLREFFESEKIEYFAALRLEDRFIVNREKLNRLTAGIGAGSEATANAKSASAECGTGTKSAAVVANAAGAVNTTVCGTTADDNQLAAVVFICPYYQGENLRGNISRYAFSRDYHLYFKGLFERLSEYAGKSGKSLRFAGFSDNSPLAEVRLAASAGLGVIGKNGLLINEKYGSYIFIGEIILAASGAEGLLTEAKEARDCTNCGICRKSCPTSALSGDCERCLSYLSQKKQISDYEAQLLRENACLWGCDRCQVVCPMNSCADISPISFFSENLMPVLTRELLGDKSDFKERLGERAFSWRGYDVLARNLGLVGK